jgi:N-acetyl-gamma-glutamyl-phosphate reductase
MTRGILTTAYTRLAGKKKQEEGMGLYRDFYKNEPFVKVVAASPHTKHTWGNNLCLIYPVLDPRTNRLIVISALDNLVKGAAGQAIQNMNLMFGFPETTALEAVAVYP